MIENLSDLYPQHYHDCVYDAVRYLPNALCVDVGAAEGKTAKQIRAASPSMRLVAFEPFPGNHDFFKSAFPDDDHVRLETLAVSDKIGEATFVVPQIVVGWEPGWETKAGYSSTGFLATVRSPSSYWQRLRKGGLTKLLGQLARRERPQVMKVRTTTLDSYFGQQQIDFCKVDTQGAEYHVLVGARQLLRDGRIGVLYIEFEDNADPRIIETLQEAGYRIFGTVFILYGLPGKPLEELGLEPLNTAQLSNGHTATEARLAPGRSVDECIAQLSSSGVRFHNDLAAVSPGSVLQFEQAMSRLASVREAGGS
jgi:FkbM family methyltransferase